MGDEMEDEEFAGTSTVGDTSDVSGDTSSDASNGMAGDSGAGTPDPMVSDTDTSSGEHDAGTWDQDTGASDYDLGSPEHEVGTPDHDTPFDDEEGRPPLDVGYDRSDHGTAVDDPMPSGDKFRDMDWDVDPEWSPPTDEPWYPGNWDQWPDREFPGGWSPGWGGGWPSGGPGE
ncbi:hypothetical protein, partial [Saccharopolyspora shandongensis]|uniref:hypothetical protein n=1 Tax=Saccharopolyspora shandongensis TaxID=418495 RepID=UPI003404E3CF